MGISQEKFDTTPWDSLVCENRNGIRSNGTNKHLFRVGVDMVRGLSPLRIWALPLLLACAWTVSVAKCQTLSRVIVASRSVWRAIHNGQLWRTAVANTQQAMAIIATGIASCKINLRTFQPSRGIHVQQWYVFLLINQSLYERVARQLRRGKHPLLFTDTEANNCFSIYNTSLIAVPK